MEKITLPAYVFHIRPRLSILVDKHSIYEDRNNNVRLSLLDKVDKHSMYVDRNNTVVSQLVDTLIQHNMQDKAVFIFTALL